MAQFRRGGRRRRKVCYFTTNKITKIDYKDVDLLNVLVTWHYYHSLLNSNGLKSGAI